MDPTASIDWALLLQCATRFATLLGADAPAEEELRRCIESVLLGRDALEAARLGIITRRELVDLVLAHLHTLILDRSGVQPEGEPWLDEHLLEDMHRGLFGTSQ